MNFKIVADSAFELNDKIKKEINISTVPLKLMLGKQQYIDDDSLDIKRFLQDMKNSPESPRSASPSPNDFMKEYEDADHVFVVTLSSKISSTYNSAVIAKNMIMESYSNKFIHVFDSLSASVGETLVGLKVYELAKSKLHNNEIVDKVNEYITEMKTFFLLESLDNLMKSGRINKIKGRLASILSIKPILGASEEGNIDLFEKVRGSKKAFRRLVDLIGEKGEKIEEKILGIAHCNALEKAIEFKEQIAAKYKFKEIIIVEMGPSISAYADEGGLLIAF